MRERLEDLPENLEVGMELDGEDGEIYLVEDIDRGYASLNANHEFAGMVLHVSGKILNVEHLTQEGVEAILKAEENHLH